MRTSLLRDILDLFFPRTCAICGNVLAGGEEMICIKCLFRMPRTDTWKQPYDNENGKTLLAPDSHRTLLRSLPSHQPCHIG